LSTRENDVSFLLAIVCPLYRLQQLLTTPGTFRLTVLVTGDSLKPARLAISFKWTGVWNQYDVVAV
jgi:hypothetical protein